MARANQRGGFYCEDTGTVAQPVLRPPHAVEKFKGGVPHILYVVEN